MKTISAQELKNECERITEVFLPQMALKASIYEMQNGGDIRSFIAVLGADHECKKSWEDIKLLTYLQLKVSGLGVIAGERFIINMSKQYPQTADCRIEIEAILLQTIKNHLKS